MSLLITCDIAPGSLPQLKALRLDHLRYIQARKGLIRFGGPTRDAEGRPTTMLILLHTDDHAVAEAFLRDEPYHASGQVFSDVRVQLWSQVLPEPAPGALDAAVAAEASNVPPPPSENDAES